MIKGIHTSAMAMRQNALRQDLTANNLANADTVGFKRDRLFAAEFVEAKSTGSTDPSEPNAGRWTDFSPGAFNPTGVELDFALQGMGFFVTSDGSRELYTRNGHFERTAEGLVVDSSGRRLQGEGGDITIPPGSVTLAANGDLSVDGVLVDRLRVVQFADGEKLLKESGSSFAAAQGQAPTPVERATIRQGFLETSNVDAVREMVEMISTARAYEVNAKLIQAQDDTLKQTVGELARV